MSRSTSHSAASNFEVEREPGRLADIENTSVSSSSSLPKVVSLFSGAGGLDLGFKQAGFPLVFAVDKSELAIKTHRRNFNEVVSIAADLSELGPRGILDHLRHVLEPGEEIAVIGGPPCQGFSRANVGASVDDPRNQLPLLYLEIVKALQSNYKVKFVLFENVLGIRDTKHSDTFSEIMATFTELGLTSNVDEYCALDYGVAQNRRRVIISGFAAQGMLKYFRPEKTSDKHLTIRDVIADLPRPTYFSRDLDKSAIPHHENHWTMRPISKRFTSPEETDGKGRSFRRLKWDEPSPTVAYGHREIHVHPDGSRRLSIYEAMLLQGFPKSFVLEGTLSSQVEQVSNAVPPPLAKALALAAREAIEKLRLEHLV